jgi:hypothetical protein
MQGWHEGGLMRGVFSRARRVGGLLAVLVILVVPVAVADDATGGPPPAPAARIGNPGGVAAESEPSFFEWCLAWLVTLQSRIGNPGG